MDPHLDFHVAVDHLGRSLGEVSVPTTAKGYEKLTMAAELLDYGLLSGLEAQSEISELLDELYQEGLS